MAAEKFKREAITIFHFHHLFMVKILYYNTAVFLTGIHTEREHNCSGCIILCSTEVTHN